MRVTTTDRRFIAEFTDLETSKELGTAPIEFSANVSSEGARALRDNAAAFYRAEQGDSRFTLTIDKVTELRITGTIRRR